MAKIIFVTDAWYNGGVNVLNATSAPGSAATNIIDKHPHLIWQTSDLGGAYFQIDRIGFAASMDTVVLCYTNANAGSTCRVRGWDTNTSEGSPLFDSGSVSIWGSEDLSSLDFAHYIYRLPQAMDVKTISVDVDHNSAIGGNFRLGTVLASVAFEPLHNISRRAGYSIGPVDTSELKVSVSGAVTIKERPVYRTGSVVLDGQQRADAHVLQEMARVYGSKQPIFVALDYIGDWILSPQDSMIYAILKFDDPPVQSTNLHRRWRVPITMREFA